MPEALNVLIKNIATCGNDSVRCWPLLTLIQNVVPLGIDMYS